MQNFAMMESAHQEVIPAEISFPAPRVQSDLLSRNLINIKPLTPDPYTYAGNNVIRIVLPNSGLLDFSGSVSGLYFELSNIGGTDAAITTYSSAGGHGFFSTVSVDFLNAAGRVEQIHQYNVLSQMLFELCGAEYNNNVALNLDGTVLPNACYGGGAPDTLTNRASTYHGGVATPKAFLIRPNTGLTTSLGVFPASLFPSIQLSFWLADPRQALVKTGNQTAADATYTLSNVSFYCQSLTTSMAYNDRLASHVITNGLHLQMPSFQSFLQSLTVGLNQQVRLQTHQYLSTTYFCIIPDLYWNRTTNASWSGVDAVGCYAYSPDLFAYDVDGISVPSQPVDCRLNRNVVPFSLTLQTRGLVSNFESGSQLVYNNAAGNALTQMQVFGFDFSPSPEVQLAADMDSSRNLTLNLTFGNAPAGTSQLFWFKKVLVSIKIEAGSGAVQVLTRS